MSQELQQQPDSWSNTNHRIVKFAHRWVVDDLRFYLKTTKPDDRSRIESAKFSPPNDSTLQFCLLLYPKGVTVESKGHASLYLKLLSSPKPEIRVQDKVSIIDHLGSKQNTLVITEIFILNSKQHGWGWEKFITHEKLNRLLTNDKLTIFCEIEAMLDSTNVYTTSDMSSELSRQIESKVLGNFGDLFENRKLNDVVLVAGDSKTEHRAHRAILAARSPVFGAMFEHDTKERNESRVLIKDIEGDVIEEMLRFIYTGKVINLNQLADGLLIAADKYELDLMKDICERHLIKNMNTETVLAMLIIADRHSAPLLRSKSIEYINKNLSSLTETSNWIAIKDKPELYFELLGLIRKFVEYFCIYKSD